MNLTTAEMYRLLHLATIDMSQIPLIFFIVILIGIKNTHELKSRCSTVKWVEIFQTAVQYRQKQYQQHELRSQNSNHLWPIPKHHLSKNCLLSKQKTSGTIFRSTCQTPRPDLRNKVQMMALSLPWAPPKTTPLLSARKRVITFGHFGQKEVNHQPEPSVQPLAHKDVMGRTHQVQTTTSQIWNTDRATPTVTTEQCSNFHTNSNISKYNHLNQSNIPTVVA